MLLVPLILSTVKESILLKNDLELNNKLKFIQVENINQVLKYVL